MENAATRPTRNKMVVARVLNGSVGIMTLTAMTGIGTGASALLKWCDNHDPHCDWDWRGCKCKGH
jgi:hypothetical protein